MHLIYKNMEQNKKTYLGKFIVGLVIVAVVGSVVWLGNRNSSQLQTISPIKIGWIGPQTGQAAVLGMDSATAVELAVKKINDNGGINGRPLKLFLEDDQYATPKAINAYQKLVHVDGVKILIMETYGAVFALAGEAKKDGVVIFDSLDCNTPLVNLGNNIFCLGVESESIAKNLAAYSTEQGYKKVGVLYFNSDTFMPYVKDVFVKEYKGETLTEGYSAGTNDFRTMLSKMRDVDALVLLTYDEGGSAMRQAREMGLKMPFLMPGTATSPSLQEASRGAAEGTIFTFWKAPKDHGVAKVFTDNFTAIKGRAPILDSATYPSYDVVLAITEALKANSSETVSKQEISKVSFEGVTGLVKFDQDGSSRTQMTVFKLHNGVPASVK